MKYKNPYKSLLPFLVAAAFFIPIFAGDLVILHTNDTHSAIDPFPDGSGGIVQRKAVIDSIRAVEQNVILVDAGDVVQGSVYYKYFHGEVEYPLMDMMGYDIRIVGNHEFDLGMEELGKYLKETKGTMLSANYDFNGTELDGIFQPYIIKEFEGKKIGFFGINIDPEGIISSNNIDVKYKDALKTSDDIALFLKNVEKCDLVVAVTHIGYVRVNEKPTDVDIAEGSEYIDLIIGGHTHTLIDPLNPSEFPSLVKNKHGNPVRIVQTGKYGRVIGKLKVNLDSLPLADAEEIEYELIPVNDRFQSADTDNEIKSYLKPYKTIIDSINNNIVGYSAYDLPQNRIGGLANLTADIAFQHGKELVDSLRGVGKDVPDIQFSIINVGGIRQPMRKGPVTEGQVLSTFPFRNRYVLVKLKGSDIIEALRVAALKGGEAVSGNMRIVTDSDKKLSRVIIDEEEMDPEKEYVLGTLDYVAEGNDDLVTLKNHDIIWETDTELSVVVMEWIKRQNNSGLEVAPDCSPRFVTKINCNNRFQE